MFLSIVMPFYNSEKFLNRSIKSVLNQDFEDYELILVNDGSTDNSENIVKNFLTEDNRIVYLNQDHKGSSSARNRGIDYATGEYLLFIDADDEYKDNALKVIYNKIIKTNIDVICFGFDVIKLNGGKLNVAGVNSRVDVFYKYIKINENLLDIIAKPYFPSVWNKAYRLSFIKENNIKMDEEVYIGEDIRFNLDVIKSCNNYYEASDIVYNYIRENEDSIINTYNRDKFFQMIKVHENKKALILEDSYIDKEEREANIYSDFQRICFSCFMDFFRKECDFSFEEKVNYIERFINFYAYEYKLSYNKFLSTQRKIINILFLINSKVILLVFAKIFYMIKFKSKRFIYLR